MPRKRLTLEALIAGGTFDLGNFRHRRALDESTEPLDDPELEAARQRVLSLRGQLGARVKAAEALRDFAAAARRQCPRCGQSLPVSEFAPDTSKGSGRKSLCRSCDREKARRYYEANRERQLAKANARNASKREAVRNAR